MTHNVFGGTLNLTQSINHGTGLRVVMPHSWEVTVGLEDIDGSLAPGL